MSGGLKEQENIPDQPVLQAEDTAAIKKHRTFGNRAFDALAWAFVQGGGVWALSLGIGYEATKGKIPAFKWLRDLTSSAQAGTERIIKGAVNSEIGQKIWKSTTPEKGAEFLTLYWVLSLGGFLLLPVTHWLEKHREPFAAKIDQVHHKVLHLSGIQPASYKPEEIQSEAKHTFSSMLGGRLFYIACSLPVAILVGPKRLEWCQKKIGGGITTLYDTLYEKIHPRGNAEIVRKFADLAVFDLILSVISAGVTFIRSGATARKQEEKLQAAQVATTDAPTLQEDSEKESRAPQFSKAKSYVDAVQNSRNSEFSLNI